jgi:hypothetical protein
MKLSAMPLDPVTQQVKHALHLAPTAGTKDRVIRVEQTWHSPAVTQIKGSKRRCFHIGVGRKSQTGRDRALLFQCLNQLVHQQGLRSAMPKPLPTRPGRRAFWLPRNATTLRMEQLNERIRECRVRKRPDHATLWQSLVDQDNRSPTSEHQDHVKLKDTAQKVEAAS